MGYSDLLYISGKPETHDVAFKSFSAPFNTSNAAGKFLMQMMGTVAELEWNRIVDNIKIGMKQWAQQGKWNDAVP